MAYTVLQVGVPPFLEQTVANIVAFLPRLVGAIVVLLVGLIVGRLLAGGIRAVGERAELDERVEGTIVDRIAGATGVTRAIALVAAYYVYILAFLAAANVLAITVLSTWLSDAVSYLPAFIAGLAIIVLGFVVADFLADTIARTETVSNAEYASAFADGTRFFLYFVVLVMGLDTMGVDVEILFLFAQAVAAGFAVGIALAIGIGFGWGSKDYVAENIDSWVGRGPSPMSESATPDGGVDNE